jgi:DNA polymerase-1
MKEGLLAANLGCTREEAKVVRERYLSTYPAVERFYASSIETARRTGFAFSILGRRRFLPEIVSSKSTDRWEAERQAVNMEIQGGAADVARMAMIRLYNADLPRHYGCKMLLQVHDEVVFECPEETADHAMEEIQLLMEHPFPTELDVPLTTSCKKSKKSWAQTK